MINFPVFNTKALSDGKKYNVNDPVERRDYFRAKLGTKIDDVKAYLQGNTFIAYLIAKKSAGKGTYTKIIEEILGVGSVAHISVGDTVRKVHKQISEEPGKKDELLDYLKDNFRGFMTPQECVDALLGRSQDKLIPTEFILALVKREIAGFSRKPLFIDGLPRSMDQISYSLFFRDLINFRDDPDMFILIDVPEAVIDERMKYRVVCPACQTSRNLKLLPTKFVKYDDAQKAYYLLCDNAGCLEYGKARMIRKEGDEKGVEPIRERLKLDAQLLEKASNLQGIPTILTRNAVPVTSVEENCEDYELTPMYSYELQKNGEVQTIEQPWIIKDDSGAECNSLLAAPVVVSIFTQLHKILIG